MGDSEDKGLCIQEVRAILEGVYKGCLVDVLGGVGGNSFHAQVNFNEYEIRVILSGPRTKTRSINFRFMQRVKGPGRKPIKIVINEVRTQDPAELLVAIRHSKEYLLGIIHSINRAFKRKQAPQVHDIEDLMLGED